MKHIMSKTNYNFLHDMLKQCLQFGEKCINMKKNEKEVRYAFNTSKRFTRTNI
jgi:hypothetical protein